MLRPTADDSVGKVIRSSLPRLPDLLASSAQEWAAGIHSGANLVSSPKVSPPLGWGTPAPTAGEPGLRLHASGGLASDGSACLVCVRIPWACLKRQPFVGGVILVLVGTPDKAVFQHTRSL